MTFIDTKTNEVHCPVCKERCPIPLPCASSVLGRFLLDFERHHKRTCAKAQKGGGA